MRRALRRLAFALVPLVVLLWAAEVAARLFWTPPPPPDLTQDEYLMPLHPTRLWGPPPGKTMGHGAAILIGPDGLRALPDEGAPLRILTLGDSNIFGFAMADADTLQERLEDALARRGVKAEVLCGGIPGYSSEQSRVLLEELGWDMKPDLLLIGNLLSDSTKEHFQDRVWMARLGQPEVQVDRTLLDHSVAWSWLRHQLIQESRVEQRIRFLRQPNLLAAERVPLDEYEENLRWMMTAAAERGVGAAIFQLVTADRLAGRPDAPGYVATQRALAQEYGVPIVDGRDVLVAAGLSEARAFVDPVHASAEANRLYAEAIAEALVAAGWPQDRLIAGE
ncbi:MAG: hypothetical protein H6739_40640 [Alphaproteobacteria bacterium]|nr:hypothetical protein [Alphaproteobacteria bacterium]